MKLNYITNLNTISQWSRHGGTFLATISVASAVAQVLSDVITATTSNFISTPKVLLIEAMDLLKVESSILAGRFETTNFENVHEYKSAIEKIIPKIEMAFKMPSGKLEIKLMDNLKALKILLQKLEVRYYPYKLREQPFGIWIEGYPGAGKTGTLKRLIRDLSNSDYYTRKPILDDEVIVLNPKDEFQSEYRSDHRGVIFDDLNNTDRRLVPDNDFTSLIDFINNTPKCALSPHLELKGLVLIRPEIVCVTSNLSMVSCIDRDNAHTFKQFTTVQCFGAQERRFKAKIIALDYDKYQLVEVDRRNSYDEFHQIEYEPILNIRDKQRSGKLEVLNYEQLLQKVQAIHEEHVKEQDEYLKMMSQFEGKNDTIVSSIPEEREYNFEIPLDLLASVGSVSWIFNRLPNFKLADIGLNLSLLSRSNLRARTPQSGDNLTIYLLREMPLELVASWLCKVEHLMRMYYQGDRSMISQHNIHKLYKLIAVIQDLHTLSNGQLSPRAIFPFFAEPIRAISDSNHLGTSKYLVANGLSRISSYLYTNRDNYLKTKVKETLEYTKKKFNHFRAKSQIIVPEGKKNKYFKNNKPNNPLNLPNYPKGIWKYDHEDKLWSVVLNNETTLRPIFARNGNAVRRIWRAVNFHHPNVSTEQFISFVDPKEYHTTGHKALCIAYPDQKIEDLENAMQTTMFSNQAKSELVEIVEALKDNYRIILATLIEDFIPPINGQRDYLRVIILEVSNQPVTIIIKNSFLCPQLFIFANNEYSLKDTCNNIIPNSPMEGYETVYVLYQKAGRRVVVSPASLPMLMMAAGYLTLFLHLSSLVMPMRTIWYTKPDMLVIRESIRPVKESPLFAQEE